MRKYSDKLIKLQSDYCSMCGADLERVEHTVVTKRHGLQLPRIKLKCFESYQMHCNSVKCFHIQKANYPKGVSVLHPPSSMGAARQV